MLHLKFDPTRPYIDKNFNMSIRTGMSQQLANRLTILGMGQAGRKQNIEKALQAYVEQLADRDAPDTPVVERFEYDGFAVTIVFGVVVTGVSRYGRVNGDYYFLTLCDDEVDAVLREVFKLKVKVSR